MAQDISKMETTQTAVEWLQNELLRLEMLDGYSMFEIFEKAKAMEKEQMHKCASFWRGKENEIEKPLFDLYYKEIYGS